MLMIHHCSDRIKKFAVFTCFILVSTLSIAQTTITSFSPLSGPVGTNVTISGSGFSPTLNGNLVFFGTIKATVSAATSGSITVSVPAGAVYENISVLNNFYTAYSAQPFIVTFPAGGGGLTPNSFAPKMNIGASSQPYSVSTGDLDGDGRPDIIVANTGSNTISVFLNTSTPGNISFAPKKDLVTGNSPHHICVVDVSGDGKPDLVVTNYADNSVSIFINTTIETGKINFTPKQDFPTGPNPESIATGDLDGDGSPDLVVTNSSGTSITILQNAGTQGRVQYINKTDIAYGGSPAGVAVGDLDGDGKPDIAVSNSTTDDVSVFRNTTTPGHLSFAVHVDLIMALSPTNLSIADIDGDGKPDLIAGCTLTIAVKRNLSGPGVISFASASTEGNAPDDYATIADLDGDGRPDIVAASEFNNAASVLRNLSTIGNTAFDNQMFYPTGHEPTGISVADFDGDGKPDLVLSNNSDSSVSILRNRTNEPYITSFSTIGGCAAAGSTVSIVGSKFTGATQVSFAGKTLPFLVTSDTVISVTVSGPVTGSISVTTLYGTGTFTVPPPIISAFSPLAASPGTIVKISGKYLCGATSISFGGINVPAFTVNADSSISAIVGTGASGSLSITTPAGTSSLPGFTFIPLPVITSFSPASGPVGSRVTITGRNFSSATANNIVYFGAVQAKVISVSDSTVIVSVPAGATYQPISLTNEDHNLTAYSRSPFVITFGNGKGLDSASFKIKNSVAVTDNFPTSSSISDLDGDGLPDLAIANFASGTATAIHNTSTNGNLSFAPKISYPVGGINTETVSVNTIDFDGDGRPDLAVVNEMDTNISILRNIGSPGQISFGPTLVLATGYESGPTSLATGDFDGDGKPDLAVVNTAGGRIAIFRNTSTPGAISFASPVYLGAFGQDILSGITMADFDNDGKPDIIATDRNNNIVYVYRNQSQPGILSFAPFTTYPTGFGGSNVLAGDLDGDGLPDIVFSNPGNSSISFMKNMSTPGNISFSARTDIPLLTGIFSVSANNVALADLDGDSKVDICLTTATTVMAFKNISSTGNIAFSPPVTFNMPSGYNFNYVSVADFNGDGKPDLAVISGNSTNVTMFLNSIDSLSAPVITSFVPAIGGHGDTIRIDGIHFTGASSVSFGGTPAIAYQVVSDSVILAVLGQGATGNVNVTDTGGTASLAGFVFSGPKIASFNPSSGSVGTTVTIHGSNFTAATSVSFGGISAGSFAVISDSVITAVVGTGATGNLYITTPKGADSLAGFTFINPTSPPIIASFNPVNGTNGTTVNIYGRNFSGTKTVTFGSVPAASFTVISDTAITAIVGTGATGAVMVTVSNNFYDSLPGFTYIGSSPAPVIKAFTPASAALGQSVTITGQHFLETTSVSFGGTSASSFSILSDSTLQAYVGTGASGMVRVTTAFGSDSLGGFTYTPPVQPPVIQSFAPVSASTGQTVAIKGQNFTGTVSVSFGGISAASFTIVSDSLIDAVVGTGASGNVLIHTSNAEDSLGGFRFIANPLQPTIASFAPVSGNSGTTVIISGMGFTGATGVSFGGIAAGSFTIASDSVIVAVVGGSGSSGNVSVTTTAGVITRGGFVFTKGLTGYPNPATDHETINFPPSPVVSRVDLLDMSGKLLLTLVVNPNASSATVSLAGIKRGLYIISWSNGTSSLQTVFLRE